MGKGQCCTRSSLQNARARSCTQTCITRLPAHAQMVRARDGISFTKSVIFPRCTHDVAHPIIYGNVFCTCTKGVRWLNQLLHNIASPKCRCNALHQILHENMPHTCTYDACLGHRVIHKAGFSGCAHDVVHAILHENVSCRCKHGVHSMC